MASQNNKRNYLKPQRVTLIVCAAIMAAYIILVYITAGGAFWDFAAMHVLVMAIAVSFIWISNVPKIVTYIIMSLSVVGAVTALGLMLYYLTIINNLANG